MEKILHWWRWITSDEQRMIIVEQRKWRVIYPDKQRTFGMGYRSAWALKQIHGGKLEKVK